MEEILINDCLSPQQCSIISCHFMLTNHHKRKSATKQSTYQAILLKGLKKYDDILDLCVYLRNK